MTDGWGTLADQVKQIQDRIDWLHVAGFHFLSTESGFSEFTHPDCTRMVAWMNATTQYARSKYGKRTIIKAHISTVRSTLHHPQKSRSIINSSHSNASSPLQGQTCAEYADPTTGVPPCNFNFLPHYADKEYVPIHYSENQYPFTFLWSIATITQPEQSLTGPFKSFFSVFQRTL